MLIGLSSQNHTGAFSLAVLLSSRHKAKVKAEGLTLFLPVLKPHRRVSNNTDAPLLILLYRRLMSVKQFNMGRKWHSRHTLPHQQPPHSELRVWSILVLLLKRGGEEEKLQSGCIVWEINVFSAEKKNRDFKVGNWICNLNIEKKEAYHEKLKSREHRVRLIRTSGWHWLPVNHGDSYLFSQVWLRTVAWFHFWWSMGDQFQLGLLGRCVLNLLRSEPAP